ncbi:ribosomal protein S18-alanine N-acetyltransferase [Methanolobus halotolerans]|uniref:Ribosomal-protein-alanine N-acetyltransferase n=1 Tax=Methanolobus halotolerans TaxID=2052935 RepID=A0A4E0Q8L7_9EURY|nr:ribosomal protein S18-alanine N-acetyltransferase [Methanolobus halotolerans]TGC11126.1 ribosomal-protein-alanine N-acetyltransferase [Methanolobus halotolerans]
MIRRVIIEDIPQIVQVEDACFPVPWPDFLFKAHLNNPGFVVYEREKEILGYAIIGDSQGKAHLQNIAVHPDFRRQGIGTDLLEWCIDLVKLYGYHEIVLEVREKNTGSHKFYIDMDFEIRGTVQDYYLDDNAIVMERRI